MTVADELRGDALVVRAGLDAAGEQIAMLAQRADDVRATAAAHGWMGVAATAASLHGAATEALGQLTDATHGVDRVHSVLLALADAHGHDSVTDLLTGAVEHVVGVQAAADATLASVLQARVAAETGTFSGLITAAADIEQSLAGLRAALADLDARLQDEPSGGSTLWPRSRGRPLEPSRGGSRRRAGSRVRW